MNTRVKPGMPAIQKRTSSLPIIMALIVGGVSSAIVIPPLLRDNIKNQAPLEDRLSVSICSEGDPGKCVRSKVPIIVQSHRIKKGESIIFSVNEVEAQITVVDIQGDCVHLEIRGMPFPPGLKMSIISGADPIMVSESIFLPRVSVGNITEDGALVSVRLADLRETSLRTVNLF